MRQATRQVRWLAEGQCYVPSRTQQGTQHESELYPEAALGTADARAASGMTSIEKQIAYLRAELKTARMYLARADARSAKLLAKAKGARKALKVVGQAGENGSNSTRDADGVISTIDAPDQHHGGTTAMANSLSYDKQTQTVARGGRR
jgi:hypothetical protein